MADVWIQERVRSNDFALVKVLGQENMADIMTKSIEKPLLVRHLSTLRLAEEDGRAQSAAHIT